MENQINTGLTTFAARYRELQAGRTAGGTEFGAEVLASSKDFPPDCCFGADTAVSSSKDFPPDCCFGADTGKVTSKADGPMRCLDGADTARSSQDFPCNGADSARSGRDLGPCVGAGTEKAGADYITTCMTFGCMDGADTARSGQSGWLIR
ncbi:MAG: hypothetical protein AB1758_36260 [Candidatus Eremiobacterota bacterium]